MITASLLTVGSEMLDLERRDANGPLARERLLALGIRPVVALRVADRVDAGAEAFRAALAVSDVVIASGGLGPTGDDLTREALAAALGREVREDAGWLSVVAERLRGRGRALTEAGRRQALIVEGAAPIPNARGLACGSFVEAGGRLVFLLPGIPAEFAEMLDSFVVPCLAERCPAPPDVRIVRAVTAGLPEAQAEPVLAPWYTRPGAEVSVLPSFGVLKITVTLTEQSGVDVERLQQDVECALRDGLGDHLVSLDGTSLEHRIGQLLAARRWTLATAESCTGGLAARKVVSVPGASGWFLGSVVAYSDEVKERVLGVPRALLEQHGAVSEQTALAMVRGVRSLVHASCAVATTGVAGPEGGSASKPVGLVYVAAATPEQETVRRINFPLDRNSIMELAANWALFQLWRLARG